MDVDEAGSSASSRAAKWRRRFEIPTIIAALLVLPVVVIEESSLGGNWPWVTFVLNWAIWSTFFLETIVMLAVVSSRRAWLRANALTVFIVLFTPPFLPASLQSARILRLLRLSRLAVTAKSLRSIFSLQGLQMASLFAVFGIVGAGALFSAVERGQHLSTWDGLWWAVTTVTTVGYGDIYPHTTEGRMLAIGVMVIGVGYVALLTGAVAQLFVQSIESEAQHVESDVLSAIDDLRTEVRSLREIAERAIPRDGG